MLNRSRTIILVALMGLLIPAWTLAQVSTTLTWTAEADPSVLGYKVYQGTVSGKYGAPVDVGKATTYTIILPTLALDQAYFFAVTAYNAVGESGKSNEVSKLIKGVPPPLQTTFVKTLTDAAGHIWALAGTAPTYDLYLDGVKFSVGSDIQLVNGTVYTQGTGTDTVNWWIWQNGAWVKVGPLPAAPAAPIGLVISSATPSEILITASAADCPSVTFSAAGPRYTMTCGK